MDEFVAENGVKVDRGVELVDLKTSKLNGPTSVSLRHLCVLILCEDSFDIFFDSSNR